MKSKGSKKTAAQNAQTKKVFDVTRPGKMPVSPTSRPVIVGHKPQVKDPMMSDRDDARPLMDSTKKVTIQPSAGVTAPVAAVPSADSDSAVLPSANPSLEQVDSRTDTVAGGTGGGAPIAPQPLGEHDGEGSASDRTRTGSESVSGSKEAEPTLEVPEAEKVEPSTANSVASIATSSAVDMPPPEVPETSAPVEKPTTSDTMTNTSGLVFDEGDGKESSTPGQDPTLAPPVVGDAEEAAEPAGPGQAIVSHHKQSGGMLTVFVWLFIVILLAAAAVDISLDMGILNISNVPHTNFFPPN